MSGCAPVATMPAPVSPQDVPTYAEGFADGRKAAQHDIVMTLDAKVGPLINERCNTSRSWLNKHGAITLKRMAFARETEMRLKKECAAKFDAVRRAYRDTVWSIRSE